MQVANPRSVFHVCLALGLPGVLTVLAGCGMRAPYFATPNEARFSKVDRGAAAWRGDSSASPQLLASASDKLEDIPLAQRVVIYNAGFRIVVADVSAAIRRMENLAESQGGYVQQIATDQITIRVPVAHYRSAVEQVEALGQVAQRQLQALDVTEDYVDLEARLKNARSVRDRLNELLKKAEDVKTALEVERELKRLGEEIEQLEAKLELIHQRVAYSTITAAFERVAPQASFQMTTKLPFRWLRELDPNRLWSN